MRNLFLAMFFLLTGNLVFSQEVTTAVPAAETTNSEFNHHGQVTFVTQGHSTFTAPYAGSNSLLTSENAQTSQTFTLALGKSLGALGEFYIDPELTGGSGLSKTEGIAGYPNAEIYRVSDAAPVWSIARFYYKKVFGFGGESEKTEDEMNQLAKTYDVNRFTAVFGRFAVNDFFDNNTFAHDPRSQFLNWTLMDHGAWDYAADTRGYSWGAYFELNQKNWAVRFASVMEPISANQMNMDTNLAAAHGDNLEFEYRYSYHDQPGVIRALLYENHAFMGNYLQAMGQSPSAPDIVKTRSYSQKFGAGLNLEQRLSKDLGIFSRISWNNGQTETWAFTEIDQSASLGFAWAPHWTKGFEDGFGAALIVNGLSDDHRQYLQAGGYGFIVGDGQLNYSYEKILEAYYLIHLNKEATVMIDAQGVSCPAYNADRGPVSIFAVRLHYEI